MTRYKLYDDPRGGNCRKAKGNGALTGLSVKWVPFDILRDDTCTEEFLSNNPSGQVPTLVADDARVVTQSNALSVYVADIAVIAYSRALPEGGFGFSGFPVVRDRVIRDEDDLNLSSKEAV